MEDVVVIQPSARFLVFRILMSIFTIDSVFAAGIIIYLLLGYSNSLETVLIILLIVHTVRFAIVSVFVMDVLVRFLGVRYYLSKDHLLVHYGIITNDERLHEVKQVKKISLYQDWFGRRMNYGTVKLEITAPSYEETIYLRSVTEPKKVVKQLEEFLS